MNSYKTFDLETWPRRDIFEYFLNAKDHLYCLSFKFNAAEFQKYIKAKGYSMFLSALYTFIRAANDVPQFRQRIFEGKVVEFESLHAVTPIMTEGELFRQIWCDYQPNLDTFVNTVIPAMNHAKNLKPCAVAPEANGRNDYICINCSPWFQYESATIPDYTPDDTIPIVSWAMVKNGKLPATIRFNHCFIDGLHVSRYVKAVQKYLNHPELLESGTN